MGSLRKLRKISLKEYSHLPNMPQSEYPQLTYIAIAIYRALANLWSSVNCEIPLASCVGGWVGDMLIIIIISCINMIDPA